ncbi:MAG: cytochrome C biogenesis protein, partial [Candidatus Aminicenantes bacterium]|nr:cytochrome C biogenesis protein [Candidatus Aminicenantes bacterium]
MIKLFSALSQAIEGAPLIAIGASFVWGILSIVLSPCHLSSIPLIIGYLSNQRELSTKKAFHLSIVFSIGILISIAVIGGITAAAGRMMGDVGKIGNYIVASVFLIFGLNLLGIIPLPWTNSEKISMKKKGMIPAISLGLFFGLALGPCTFAFMAPILGIVFRLTTTKLVYGLLLLAAFALGHCGVIIAAGTSSKWIQNYLNWNEKSKG